MSNPEPSISGQWRRQGPKYLKRPGRDLRPQCRRQLRHQEGRQEGLQA